MARWYARRAIADHASRLDHSKGEGDVEDDEGRVVEPVLRVGTVTPWSIDIEWDEDPAATGWRVRQIPGHGRYEPTGQPRWRSTGLEPQTCYEFRVFAVDEDHDEHSVKSVVRAWTLA